MNLSLIIPSIGLSLPAYLLSQFAAEIIQPRKTVGRFVAWAIAVISIAMIWFWVCLFLYSRFFMHKA